jgi:plastocyanin
MCRAPLLICVLATAACCGCSNATPANPDQPITTGPITIDILGVNGARSFSPNPATLQPGQIVVWHNLDIYTHHVVLDDRTLDAGTIEPGHFSATTILPAPGPYHCSIHPSMTGAIVSGHAGAVSEP